MAETLPISGQVRSLPVSPQKKRATATIRMSLIHSDGCASAVEADPALSAEDLGAEESDGDERKDTDAVGPVDGVDKAVIVNQRDEKHQNDADCQEADLFLIEAVELGVEGRGLDLEDRDQREQKDEAEKNPVEVAIGGEAGHVCC